MSVESVIPLADDILDGWRATMGPDFDGYRNHVYRMLNFGFALRQPNDEERQKMIIAGCFHDLGIWSDDTFDYLPPSIELASRYLNDNGLKTWNSEIETMIDQHHKLRTFTGAASPLVETFRRADLVDFSLGLFKFGLSSSYVGDVNRHFPNSGFHRQLVSRAGRWICRHPLNPIPVLKW